MTDASNAQRSIARRVQGGCHCGAVRFRATVTELNVVRCNCSVCTKKGYLHLQVENEQFELLQGEDAIHTYTFGTHTAKHHFCRHCGIHSFYRARSHPDKYDLNVHCLDDFDVTGVEIYEFDGRQWEENVEALRKR